MTDKELFNTVKRYMVEHGVTCKPIPKTNLCEEFGVANISRLHRKNYIIFIGKGVTIGLR